MTRPLVIDSFMVNNELDMLQCRLEEIGGAVDYMIAVEAEVDHQDHPKPFWLTENLGRFSEWKDKLIVVQAKGLPTADEDGDPWAREHAQREHTWTALADLDLPPTTVILHGDIDEVPSALVARNVRPKGFVAFRQRGHFWSCRWVYPTPWQGTVATTLGNLTLLRERLKRQHHPRAMYEGAFGAMRDSRNIAPALSDAGWHLSWLPNGDTSPRDSAVAKVGSYCHPEVTERIITGLDSERFLRHGIHVDGVKMTRCEIDDSFPRYVREGRCPESWLL